MASELVNRANDTKQELCAQIVVRLFENMLLEKQC